MKVFVEGYKYQSEELKSTFDSSIFYTPEGILTSVGYYHSYDKNQTVYMLPKVFLKNGNALGLTPEELVSSNVQETLKHKQKNKWTRELFVYFYNSVAEFRRRRESTIITDSTNTSELNTNIGKDEYSYIDLLNTFLTFYKKNKTTILYHHVEFISNQARKPRWEKTIRKSLPIIVSDKYPLYFEIKNRQKKVNDEEELLCYFFSILNRFKEEHDLPIKIDKSYRILTGSNFEKLQRTGISKLRKIKHRYFADTLKRMYQLCELYFNQTDLSSIKRKKEEYISFRNYNVVFEDMIDKLLTDPAFEEKLPYGISIGNLKNNKDGKIIDHIFKHRSLIDNTEIFYIGDSKYYKPENEAGDLSSYKQFTYAKNIVQFNIDLSSRKKQLDNTRYRDELTEGYNITPNFFIYGQLGSEMNFDDDGLIRYKKPKKSFHFKNRLFDRDTLFVLQYSINYLFVLKQYTSENNLTVLKFRNEIKRKLRNALLSYFNNSGACKFTFYEKHYEVGLTQFVNDNFRSLLGKSITIENNKLLIAVHKTDESNPEINDLLEGYTKKKLK